MEDKLLVLGLLMSSEMHGYQINEMIEMHLGSGIQLKKSLIYKLLGKMADDGWLTFTEEQAGKRPTRRVYAITDEGQNAFQNLLLESLADYKPADLLGHIAEGYIDMLPSDQALARLEKRRQKIESLLQDAHFIAAHSSDVDSGSHRLIVEHQVHHLASELEWIDYVISQFDETKSDII
ncbi:MAG: PadR family transcriptional regulator [Anaerolineae bacterium]|nr:PadR family transcriptional regulator [Anaerolineae bacterium]